MKRLTAAVLIFCAALIGCAKPDSERADVLANLRNAKKSDEAMTTLNASCEAAGMVLVFKDVSQTDPATGNPITKTTAACVPKAANSN